MASDLAHFVCPAALRIEPDFWFGVVALVLLALTAFDVVVFVRVIRTGRFRMYRDEKLNPRGRAAVLYVAIPLAITTLGTGLVVWLFACACLRA